MKKLLRKSAVLFVLAFAACSPITMQGTLDFTGAIAGGAGVTPTGEETAQFATYGQLVDGNVRVQIPLTVLGVAVEDLQTMNIEVVNEDDQTRAYDLEPAALYFEDDDAIEFVVNQLDDGDLLTVSLLVDSTSFVFSAPVSAATSIAVTQSEE